MNKLTTEGKIAVWVAFLGSVGAEVWILLTLFQWPCYPTTATDVAIGIGGCLPVAFFVLLIHSMHTDST